ncbi:protein translation factor SUI1 homolog [Striga asiatica]|uniref:Protein translation factor SUI1 homolog n=1 Tax=Striga asiatica TaxID=4170 RepID=A0A5A7PBQ2_STRAF|nr:protein translation factor SUI1 homolog [Striga asiatica]
MRGDFALPGHDCAESYEVLCCTGGRARDVRYYVNEVLRFPASQLQFGRLPTPKLVVASSHVLLSLEARRLEVARAGPARCFQVTGTVVEILDGGLTGLDALVRRRAAGRLSGGYDALGQIFALGDNGLAEGSEVTGSTGGGVGFECFDAEIRVSRAGAEVGYDVSMTGAQQRQ